MGSFSGHNGRSCLQPAAGPDVRAGEGTSLRSSRAVRGGRATAPCSLARAGTGVRGGLSVCARAAASSPQTIDRGPSPRASERARRHARARRAAGARRTHARTRGAGTGAGACAAESEGKGEKDGSEREHGGYVCKVFKACIYVRYVCMYVYAYHSTAQHSNSNSNSTATAQQQQQHSTAQHRRRVESRRGSRQAGEEAD